MHVGDRFSLSHLDRMVDETEELVVHHFFLEAPQDRLVGDFVKASLDIPLDDPGVTRQRRMATTGHCMVRTPVGPKPVGVLVELDLTNGLQRYAVALFRATVGRRSCFSGK
jgi:hypothetical protein